MCGNDGSHPRHLRRLMLAVLLAVVLLLVLLLMLGLLLLVGARGTRGRGGAWLAVAWNGWMNGWV